jgi:PLP dependent protein
VVELIERLDPEVVRENLTRIEAELAAAESRGAAKRAGRPAVEVLAATKYLPSTELPTLASAGVRVVGENRAQDLEQKVSAHGDLFAWDFIGTLQSRRVRLIVPHVRLIHSVASESAVRALDRCREIARPGARLLLEVNVAGEEAKAGVAPERIAHYLENQPLPVAGLMTMPPLAEDPESSRPWFAALRELADRHGLEHLSMGTSQDYVVAAEEGATIVRIGTSLYRPGGPEAPPDRPNH